MNLLQPSSINKLITPIALAGIGPTVELTHEGLLKNFPPPFNKAFYGINLTSNVISLGNIQRLGGWYGIHPDNNQLLLVKSSTHGPLIGKAFLSSNNLLPSILLSATNIPNELLPPNIPLTLVHNNSTSTLNLPTTPAPTIIPLSPVPSQLQLATADSHNILCTSICTPCLVTAPTPTNIPAILTASQTSLPSVLLTSPILHLNKEQRTRAALAHKLHYFNHNSNIINGTACECGIIPLQLTRADFDNMSAIYGHCGSCVSGKNSTITHGPTSHSTPPISAGEFLHADLITLDNGVTVLLSKDDHTGYVLPIKLIVGKTKGSLSEGWDATRRHYNALGWTIKHINTDSEEAFKSSQGPLQDRGILCTVTPPDKHEKSLERTWQTIKKKMAVIIDSLTYVLPSSLHFSLLQFTCDVLNNHPNSNFPFSTPHIIVHKTHNGYSNFPNNIPLPFGTIVRSLERPGLEPQTGIIVGITANSTGSQQVFYPKFHHQQSSTILSRAATQLTVLPLPLHSWNLTPQSPSPHQLLPSEHHQGSHTVPIDQPLLNPPSSYHPLPTLTTPINPNILHPPSLNIPPVSIPTPLPVPTIPPPSPTLLQPLPPNLLPFHTDNTLPITSDLLPIIHPPHPLTLFPTLPSPSLPPLPFPSPTTIVPLPIPSTPISSPAPLRPINNQLSDSSQPRYVTRSITRLSNTPAPSSLTLPAPRYNTRSTSQPQSQQQPTTTSVPSPPQSLLSATSPLNTTSPTTTQSPPPSSNSIKPGALRRLLLSRAASVRAKPYSTADKERNNIPVNNANFHYPTITPIKQTNEFSLTTALAMTGIAASKVIDATQAEMHKCLIKYGSFQPIQYGDIETTAIRLPSIIFYKQKDLDLKARLVVCGTPNYIPSDARGVTYAGAADPANIIAVDAAYRADAIHRHALDQLITFTTDIPSAYLQNKLTRQDTAGHQVVMKLPTKLPHPLAGTWVELIQSQYGLPWSNSIHARELTLTLATTGFHPAHVPGYAHTPVDRYIYHCVDPLNPFLKSTLCVTVDDIKGIGFHQPHFDLLLTVLRERYGQEVEFDYTFKKYAGQQYHTQPDGALTVDCSQYIQEMLTSFGITTIEGASTPTSPDFFHPTDDPLPFNTVKYQKATGALTWISTRGRPDITMAVNFLSSFNQAPTAGHWLKVLRIFRYLHYTTELGLTYYTIEGPILHCSTDVSYNSQSNGDAQAGVLLSIGRYSAPIYIQSGHLRRKIPLGPCQAEYMGMTNGVKAVMWFRNLLAAIGYPQQAPTPLYVDNMSAKHLAESPSIQRRSRHIEMFEHCNRQAVQDGVVQIIHERTANQRADILTKPMGPLPFIYQRSILLNQSARSVFDPTVVRKSLHNI